MRDKMSRIFLTIILSKLRLIRHCGRRSTDPKSSAFESAATWMPAFAGMTSTGIIRPVINMHSYPSSRQTEQLIYRMRILSVHHVQITHLYNPHKI